MLVPFANLAGIQEVRELHATLRTLECSAQELDRTLRSAPPAGSGPNE
jgi:hypothetical protein